MRVTKPQLILILHLMGWEVGSGFLDQSESEVKQIHSISISTLTLKLLLLKESLSTN